ncbi:MAG: PulJ/GspJ family protein [Armatimonadota bacterium]
MTRRLTAEDGYTLIEIVVAAVPLTIVALSLFGAFGFTVNFSRRGEAGIEAVQQARAALHFMTTELREANSAPGAIVTWSRQAGADQDGLGFLSARSEGPGRPFDTDPYGTPRWQHAVYYVHDHARGELRRLTGPAMLVSPPTDVEGRTVARQVKDVRFERRGDIVAITLTVARPSGVATLEMAVRPRN